MFSYGFIIIIICTAESSCNSPIQNYGNISMTIKTIAYDWLAGFKSYIKEITLMILNDIIKILRRINEIIRYEYLIQINTLWDFFAMYAFNINF